MVQGNRGVKEFNVSMGLNGFNGFSHYNVQDP